MRAGRQQQLAINQTNRHVSMLMMPNIPLWVIHGVMHWCVRRSLDSISMCLYWTSDTPWLNETVSEDKSYCWSFLPLYLELLVINDRETNPTRHEFYIRLFICCSASFKPIRDEGRELGLESRGHKTVYNRASQNINTLWSHIIWLSWHRCMWMMALVV